MKNTDEAPVVGFPKDFFTLKFFKAKVCFKFYIKGLRSVKLYFYTHQLHLNRRSHLESWLKTTIDRIVQHLDVIQVKLLKPKKCKNNIHFAKF